MKGLNWLAYRLNAPKPEIYAASAVLGLLLLGGLVRLGWRSAGYHPDADTYRAADSVFHERSRSAPAPLALGPAPLPTGDSTTATRPGVIVEPRAAESGGHTRSKKPTLSPGEINLNTADEATLSRLPGVGPATARAILAYRAAHGPFARVADLTAVKGIGPKKLEQIAPFARVR